jgi:NAD(P)-dependent dehydrogenase (short-subunit alcohol dehydrogenase family)
LNDLFSLDNEVAVLSGAGGHLVGEMARALEEAGASVCLIDANEDALARTTASLEVGDDAFTQVMDVVDRTAWEKACDEILVRYGKVDILINGAGINAPTPFFEITSEEWHRILDVQLTGTMLGCQVLGAEMVKRGKGSIVNISSASAGPPLSKAFTYSVAKAGVTNLTQNLAREWGEAGVRVNALRPGFFPTQWSKENFLSKERTEAILGHTPMRRFGSPNELVGTVIWLCSRNSSFVTGAEIPVDGGFSAMTI